jgi:protein-tyrosine phosphatase
MCGIFCKIVSHQEVGLQDVKKICFVCLGNIVRSPLAESLFKSYAEKLGVGHLYAVDSAGMSDWHVGEPPDLRMRRVAARYGVSYDGHARHFRKTDLDEFDLILVMDQDNYDELLYLNPSPEQLDKVRFLREFDPEGGPRVEVPDPYYGGAEGFELVYEVIDRSVRGLLGKLENSGAMNDPL